MPLSKEELDKAMERIRRKQKVEEFSREEAKAIIEYSRLPWWIQEEWYGDRTATDYQGWDYEDEHDSK